MGKKGIGKALKGSSGMKTSIAKSMDKAQRIGEGLMSKAGPLLTGLGLLETAEQYSNIELSVQILAKMEARMLDRLTVAEKTLANAKRSPYLQNSDSVPQLEAVIKSCRDFSTYLGTCGPLLRGASLHDYNPVMKRLGTWLTDALIAVQLDIMLAISNGQVAPQGHNPGGGAAPGQMQDAGVPVGNAMMGPQPQPSLVPTPPPPPFPGQQYPVQHQVPMDGMHGMPQMRTALFPQTAVPTRGAVWSNKPEINPPTMHRTPVATGGPGGPAEDGCPEHPSDIPPLLVHKTPPAIVGAATGHDGVEAPSSTDAVPSMANDKPTVTEAPISSDKDTTSREAPQPPETGVERGNQRTAWVNLRDLSSHRSLAETAALGSERTMSPLPSDATTETEQMAPGVAFDRTEIMRRTNSISHATRKLREALGIDGTKWHGPESLSFSPMKHQMHNEMPGAPFGGHVVYDSMGWPYYFDPKTGRCYRTG